jgi:hypothetical protein
MPLAMNLEVIMLYPSLAYRAEMVVEKIYILRNLASCFSIVKRRKYK